MTAYRFFSIKMF